MKSHYDSNPTIKPQRLKELRLERHLSQKDLADAIGVTKQAVSTWERSESDAPINSKNLEKLADTLGCTPDYLQGNTDQKNCYTDGENSYKIWGMKLSRLPDIERRLKLYSPEKLEFLYRFMAVFDLLSSEQYNLLLRIFSTIAAVELPNIAVRHPLNDWGLFQNIFLNTKETVEAIRKELEQICSSSLPPEIDMALNSFSDSVKKDYEKLSRPLQSEEKFQMSLENIRWHVELICNSLSNLSKQGESQKNIIFYKNCYKDKFDASLREDTETFFRNLKETSIMPHSWRE